MTKKKKKCLKNSTYESKVKVKRGKVIFMNLDISREIYNWIHI